MATRRLMSKRARVALYVALLFVVWSACTLWLLVASYRVFERRLDDFRRGVEGQLQELRLLDRASPEESRDAPGTPSGSDRMTEDDVPRYIVLGHGRSKRFGYIDIQYVCDGEVDRFIYRPETILSVVDDIERETFRHERGLVDRGGRSLDL